MRRRTSGKSQNNWSFGVWLSSVLIFAYFGYLIVNLVVLQVLEHEKHTYEAAELYHKKIIELPQRGSIYDTDWNELAFSTRVYEIGVTPKHVESIYEPQLAKEDIAKKVTEILDLDYDTVIEVFKDDQAPWVSLKKKAEKKEADLLRDYISEKGIGGFKFDGFDKRVYPAGSLAGNLIGFTDEDGRGQLGLEYFYNADLTGTEGYIFAESDNYGNHAVLPFAVPMGLEAKDGLSLITTIDKNIQEILENELLKTVKANKIAEGGIAIVMDPYTGSVLGMAGTEGFNPNSPGGRPENFDTALWDEMDSEQRKKYLEETVWRNKVISENFEPGSTFKAITAAMAMEIGAFNENEVVNDRPIEIADQIIDCHRKGGHGKETARAAFWNSCNPIFVQLSQRVGISRFYDFVRAFGFYEPTGIDLPGEASGIFHTHPAEIDMACLAFGEQSTVTPLALINAYAAFANGGTLMKPRIVKALADSDGNIVKEVQPVAVRQVVSEQTAARVRELLEGVVTYGTGSKGYIPGYHVGGKTGTSTRHDEEYVISFLSMAPMIQPKICILVVLYAPDKDNASSGIAAAGSAVMTEKILDYMRIDRDLSKEDFLNISKGIEVPNLQGMTLSEAGAALSALGFNLVPPEEEISDKARIYAQYPLKKEMLHKNASIAVFFSDEEEAKQTLMPDLKGKTVSECISAMSDADLNIIIEGLVTGVATLQEIEAGEELDTWTPVTVTFGDE